MMSVEPCPYSLMIILVKDRDGLEYECVIPRFVYRSEGVITCNPFTVDFFTVLIIVLVMYGDQ